MKNSVKLLNTFVVSNSTYSNQINKANEFFVNENCEVKFYAENTKRKIFA